MDVKAIFLVAVLAVATAAQANDPRSAIGNEVGGPTGAIVGAAFNGSCNRDNPGKGRALGHC